MNIVQCVLTQTTLWTIVPRCRGFSNPSRTLRTRSCARRSQRSRSSCTTAVIPTCLQSCPNGSHCSSQEAVPSLLVVASRGGIPDSIAMSLRQSQPQCRPTLVLCERIFTGSGCCSAVRSAGLVCCTAGRCRASRSRSRGTRGTWPRPTRPVCKRRRQCSPVF